MSTKEKSKQNIARDMEVKNNLTIAREEGGGDSGGRVSGTTLKDTWTKPKGKGGSRGGRWVWLWGEERWGKNADNCN